MDLAKSPGNPAAQAAGILGSGMSILWLLFWSAITGIFDVLWLGILASRIVTWSYDTASGTILESRVELGKDSDGDTTYDAKIAYEYVINGKKYRGTMSGDFSFRMNGGRREAEWNVARFPVGKKVAVYFDPKRPDRSVIDRNLRGRDFFLPLFMNPFNLIMLGGWYGVLSVRRKGARPAGIRVRDDGLKVVARLYDVTPLARISHCAAETGGLLES